MPSASVLFHALLWAVASAIGAKAANVDVSLLHAHVDEFTGDEDQEVAGSVCLLQKDAVINAAAQPAGYDGPWVSPKGYDQWEKQYVSDPIHGAYFKNPKDMGPSTTSQLPEPQHHVVKVKMAPTDSPVDSLNEAGPVHPPKLVDGQALWQSCSWSAALFGVGATWVFFFILVSAPGHNGRQSTTKYTLSTTFAVFCGKLSYAAVDLFIAAALQQMGFSQAFWKEFLTKDATEQAFCVRLLLVGVLYVLAKLSLVLCYFLRYGYMRALTITCNLGAALVGFAVVDACGVALRLHGVDYDSWTFFWVAVLCGLVIAMTLFVCTKFTHGERASNINATSALETEAQHYTEAVAELDNIVASIALGFLVFKVIESAILSGRMQREALDSESSFEISWMVVAVPLLVAAAFGVPIAEQEANQPEGFNISSALGRSRPTPVSDMIQASLLIAAGWCGVCAFSWLFSSGSLQADLLQAGFSSPPLAAALVLSAIVMFGVVFLGHLRGTETLWHRRFHHTDHWYWNLVIALGFAAGLSWANCFIHCARDLSALWPTHAHAAEAFICLGFAVFVMPFWMIFVLPEIENPLSKAETVLHRAEDIMHQAEAGAEHALHRMQEGLGNFMGRPHGEQHEGMLSRFAHKAEHMVERLRGHTDQ